MLATCMYLFALIWILCLALSAYGTYRLYEYGPFNANLVWSLVRNVTDWLSGIALGIVMALFLAGEYEFEGIHILYHIGAFCIGFVIGWSILIIVPCLVASPYLKKKREWNEHFDETQKAEAERIANGIMPERKSFFPNDKEWVRARITQHKVE